MSYHLGSTGTEHMLSKGKAIKNKGGGQAVLLFWRFTKSFYAQITLSEKHSLEGVGSVIISIAICLGLPWNSGFNKK